MDSESLLKAVGEDLGTIAAALEATQVSHYFKSAYEKHGATYNSEFDRLTQLMEAEQQMAEVGNEHEAKENVMALQEKA